MLIDCMLPFILLETLRLTSRHFLSLSLSGKIMLIVKHGFVMVAVAMAALVGYVKAELDGHDDGGTLRGSTVKEQDEKRGSFSRGFAKLGRGADKLAVSVALWPFLVLLPCPCPCRLVAGIF